MEMKSLAERKKLFISEIKVINLITEYGTEWTGTEKWAIVTDLPQADVTERFGDVLELFTPFMFLTEEIGMTILESTKNWNRVERTERNHCTSLDSFIYEGTEIGVTDNLEIEKNAEFEYAISKFNKKQLSRLEKYSDGMSYQAIADDEGVNVKTIYECIDGARKKFFKNFPKSPQ